MVKIIRSEQSNVVAVSIFFIILPTIATSARFVARRMQKLPILASDYAILIALFASYWTSAGSIYAVYAGGVGLHFPTEAGMPVLLKYLKYITMLEVSYNVCLGFTRISLVLLYMQLFSISLFKKIASCVLGYCVVYMLVGIFANILICQPIEFNWNPTIPGSCGNRNALWVAIGAINSVTDVVVLLLPIRMVWQLHVNSFNKWVLTLTFGMGVLVCVTSIIRLKFLLDVEIQGDLLYTAYQATVWSIIEPCLAVTIANFPTLGPLVRKLFGKRASTSPSQSYPLRNYQLQKLESGTRLTQPGSETMAVYERGGYQDDFEQGAKDKSGTIKITSQWEVRRQEL